MKGYIFKFRIRNTHIHIYAGNSSHLPLTLWRSAHGGIPPLTNVNYAIYDITDEDSKRNGRQWMDGFVRI